MKVIGLKMFLLQVQVFKSLKIFVESIFDKHVNWTDLLQKDDNYKNILQVMIQKEFKITPSYMEISEYDEEEGYHMGVFICMGQNVVNLSFTGFNSV